MGAIELPNTMLALSTYLGHSTVADTYWYLGFAHGWNGHAMQTRGVLTQPSGPYFVALGGPEASRISINELLG